MEGALGHHFYPALQEVLDIHQQPTEHQAALAGRQGDQQIDVTVITGIAPGHGAEYSQIVNAVTLCESTDFGSVFFRSVGACQPAFISSPDANEGFGLFLIDYQCSRLADCQHRRRTIVWVHHLWHSGWLMRRDCTGECRRRNGGSFGVIEEEPVSEVPVEVRQVVEEQVLVVIHELFLEGAIEAFGVGVHFRRAGVRPPVRDAAFLQALLEVAQKLRAVVGEHEAWGFRQEMAQGVQREGRLAARRGGGGKGDGEAGVRVDEGEQVAAEAGLEAHHGIAGEHLEWPMSDTLGLAGFAGPGHGFGATAGVQADGGVPHLVGRPGDEASDGGDTGQGEARAADTRGGAGRGVWPCRGWGRSCAGVESPGAVQGAKSTDGDGGVRWSGRPRPSDRRRPG